MIYDPANFQALGDFPTAVHRLRENEAKLSELGAIICQHGLQDIAGITLLHKHFDLKHDEFLLREYSNNSVHVDPHRVTDPASIVPYLWGIKKDPDSGMWMSYPLEFIRPTEVNLPVKDQSEAVSTNTVFLKELGTRLAELELLETFGVALLFQNVIPLGEGEVLLEGTEFEDRENVSVVAHISEFGVQEINTPTLWRFTPEWTRTTERQKLWEIFAR
jgi:hypothetical protein